MFKLQLTLFIPECLPGERCEYLKQVELSLVIGHILAVDYSLVHPITEVNIGAINILSHDK